MTFPTSNTLTPDYGWNGSRYYSFETGQFVSFSDVRDVLEEVIQNSQANISIITEQLQTGVIDVADWQSAMMENIKLIHTASAASANGGWAQMTPSDWGASGQLIREQYDFLRNFSSQIADGTQPLDGRLLVRADMYGEAGRGTFETMRGRMLIAQGFNEARRVLGAADHCDDCLEYASEGWMPAEDVPEIGNSVCLTRCMCTIEYRNSETGETSEE